MDKEWLVKSGDEENTVPSAGLGYDEQFWIEDVRVTPQNCPECLLVEEPDCSQCTFFPFQTCRLRRDPFMMQDIRTLFSIYRDRRAAQFERQQVLIHAVRSELQTHGRPLHYTVLARMVVDRNPKLQVSEIGVLKIMASHSDVFEKIAEGVYKCKKVDK